MCTSNNTGKDNGNNEKNDFETTDKPKNLIIMRWLCVKGIKNI